MLKTATKRMNLHEELYFERFDNPDDHIDTDKCIVKDVAILGKESGRGRDYTDHALDRAVELYEGAEIFCDHIEDNPNMKRSVTERFGFIKNARRVGDKVRGDIHYLESHPFSGRFVETVRRFPDEIGLSHDAIGAGSRKGGRKRELVEDLIAVRSVDIVRKPATNRNIFEDKDEDIMPQQLTVRRVFESLDRKDPMKRFMMVLKEQVESDEVAVMDAPVEGDASAPSSDESVKNAIREMIVAAFDDDSLDTKATLKKIRDILNAQDKLLGKKESSAPAEDSGGSESDSGGETPVQEGGSRDDQLLARLNVLENEGKVRRLLEDQKVTADADTVTALAKLDDESRDAMITRLKESAPQKGGSNDPDDDDDFLKARTGRYRTGSRLFEDEDVKVDTPKDAKSFARSVRS